MSQVLSQTGWFKKEISDNFSVSFPNNPTYKLKDKAGTFGSKTKDNILVAIVQYDVIPHYMEFLKLPTEQQTKLIDIFLDNAVRGLLKASGNDNNSYTSIQIGTYKGRKTSYSSINPATGERTMSFCKIFYAFNKAIIFQCQYQSDGSSGENEKNIFLNSITLN